MERIANRLKNDHSQCHDMWKKIQLIVIKIMSLGYNKNVAKHVPNLPLGVKRAG
ncbi:hypothetical protein [Symbiopectobacterium sp. RP]|uniref:hypothetical protein n=1 Tax=Symbiopectobacterium sp. RP TaxID=3248553 RepID=UPI003D275846